MRGPFIRTIGGTPAHLLSLSRQDVRIADIAHALAQLNRFTGHAREPYSVAAHSVNVAELVRRRGGTALEQLLGLMHDAPEAYVCDASGPLKAAMREIEGRDRSAYDMIERGVWLTIAARFDLPSELPEIVERADKDICEVEGLALVLGWTPSRDVDQDTRDLPYLFGSWRGARRGFLDSWHRLRGGRS